MGGGAHFFYHLVHSILFLIYNVADIGKVIGVQNRVHVGPKNIKCICTAKILQHLVECCIKSTCVSNADVFFKRGLDSNFFQIQNIF